jgi:thiol-disulfide isomerase/thioredoxin
MLRKVYIKIVLLISVILLSACSGDVQHKSQSDNQQNVITYAGKSIEVYDYLSLKELISQSNDTLYLFNFWATWCKPCVKELPYFDMIDSAYSGQAVKVILISLDFVENTKDVLIPFLNKNDVQSSVILLDEVDGNVWISDVDPDWEGDIPATLFKRGDKTKFMAHSFNYKELEAEVELFLNP